MRFLTVVYTTIACLLATAAAWAGAPANYYSTINTQSGEALKLELRAIISGQRGYPVSSISYTATRDALLNSVDNVGGGHVRMIYTNDLRPTTQWNTTINREHTWPQSYGAGVSPKQSDMHALFLIDSAINSTRGNMLYGYVTGGTAATNFTGLPQDQNFYRNGVWQVSSRHRGDVARAIFYMATRYADFSIIDRGQTLAANQMGYLGDLLQWHQEDPVDSWEQGRNDRVFVFQNNRNPYIDNPNWVSSVFGGTDTNGPTLTALTTTPTVPFATNTVSVSVNATDPDGIGTVQLFHRVGTSGGFSSIAMTGSGGVYTTTAPIPGQPEGTVVQYYVQATDTFANVSVLPAQGATNPASYTVAGDAPVLLGLTTDPASVEANQTVHLLVDAYDDDGNGAGNLALTARWRIEGTTTWTPIAMTLQSGNTWRTSTPVPGQPGGTTVEFYVQAVDTGSASSVLPQGAPASPATYFVEPIDPFIPIATASDVWGRLLLTEVAHAAPANSGLEFVEIINVSDQGYLLDGVMLTDNNVGTTTEGYLKFPAGTTISPGDVILVYTSAAPEQSALDGLSPTVAATGGVLQVFATTAGLTFNGVAVPQMVTGSGGGPALSNADNMAMVLINPSSPSEEQFAAGDVIDGVGWGNITTANTVVGWGGGITSSASTDNVTIGSANGVARTGPADTNVKGDWTTSNPLTPGVVPTAFGVTRVDAWSLF